MGQTTLLGRRVELQPSPKRCGFFKSVQTFAAFRRSVGVMLSSGSRKGYSDRKKNRMRER